ncbi:Multidrug resistance-associated protein 1 [Tolypocladium ophioglossoides CBS 100239]|uniref:Multidrug resistance-associated protein 1 n=1 Tax=Tolypocladium ophioglossoides (strain CBS 100239) TaxID=1163406 RepID=A0A0L0N164_TOLOC|nr:Multidrug resistance-associated protein 1 [Tolypocladium ophioglossoides CBS 100239]
MTDVAIIASGATYVASIIPLLIIALYFLQRVYLRTSRQMRILDLEAKSPLYTQFTETAAGVQHIRAFSWENECMAHSLTLLDHSQKPYYYMFCIQRWLTVVLDLFVLIIAVVLSAIGLALLNVLNFGSGMSQLVDAWISLETSLGAIARLRTFLVKTPTEQEPSGELELGNWPQHGRIELRDVSARYKYAFLDIHTWRLQPSSLLTRP